MAPTSKNVAATLTNSMILEAGSRVCLPASVLTFGAAGASIQFGTIPEAVRTAVMAQTSVAAAGGMITPAQDVHDVVIPRLPSRGRRPNVVIPNPPRRPVSERLTYTSASKRMVSEGRLIFPKDSTHKTSVFDRLTFANNKTITIPPARTSFKRNNQSKAIRGKNYIQQSHMIHYALPTHNSFAPLGFVKKNATTAVLRPMPKISQPGSSKKSQTEFPKENISKRIYEAYKAIKGRIRRSGAQKSLSRNKVWIRKDSVRITKDPQE